MVPTTNHHGKGSQDPTPQKQSGSGPSHMLSLINMKASPLLSMECSGTLSSITVPKKTGVGEVEH